STPVGHHLMTHLYSYLVRGGVSVAQLSTNDTFVYGGRSTMPLNVQVLPGDEITTQCLYDSTSRTNTTRGGYG
ncbi:MAG: hypothetical protein EOP45_11850, partial [Sphingobacteriaceae bacterium]